MEQIDICWYDRPEVEGAALDVAFRDHANGYAHGKIALGTEKTLKGRDASK